MERRGGISSRDDFWSVVDARNVLYTSRLCCRAFRSLEGARKNDANLDILFFLPPVEYKKIEEEDSAVGEKKKRRKTKTWGEEKK